MVVHPFHIVFIDALPYFFFFCLKWFIIFPMNMAIWSRCSLRNPPFKNSFGDYQQCSLLKCTGRWYDCYIVRTCEKHHMFMPRNGWRKMSGFTPSGSMFWFVKYLIFWCLKALFTTWVKRWVDTLHFPWLGPHDFVGQIHLCGFVQRYCGWKKSCTSW